MLLGECRFLVPRILANEMDLLHCMGFYFVVRHRLLRGTVVLVNNGECLVSAFVIAPEAA